MNHTNEGGCCKECYIPVEPGEKVLAFICTHSCHTASPQSSSAAVEEVERNLPIAMHEYYRWMLEHPDAGPQERESQKRHLTLLFLSSFRSRLTKLIEEARRKGYMTGWREGFEQRRALHDKPQDQ